MNSFLQFKQRSILLVALITLFLSGCGGSDSDESTKSPDLPAGDMTLKVSCNPGILRIGGMGQCRADGIFTRIEKINGEFREVSTTVNLTNRSEWKSQDATIVSVDQAGKITGLEPGTVKISATFDDETASASVTVLDAELLSIAVNCNPDVILVGQMTQCVASGNFRDANGTFARDITKQVSWVSDKPGAATVDNEGKVTGVSPDTARITASSGNVSGFDDVTVRTLNVTALDVTPDAATIPPFCTLQYTAIATFEDGSTADVTTNTNTVWGSSIPETTVDGAGLATAGPQGTVDATITASFTDAAGNTESDAVMLSVEDTAVATLCVEAAENADPTSATCNVDPNFSKPVGISVPFLAKLTYNSGSVCPLAPTDTRVTWDSTVSAVATVDNTGVASTLTDGMTDIEATMAVVPITGSHPLIVGNDLLLDYAVLPKFACAGFFTSTVDNLPTLPPPSPGMEQMKAEGGFQITGPTCDFANPDACTGALNASTDWAANEGFWNGAQCDANVPTDMAPAGDFSPPATVDANGLVTPTGQIRIGTACIVGTHTPTGMLDGGTIVVFPVADDAQLAAAGELCDQFEPLFQAGGEDGGAGALTQLISALGQLLNPIFIAPPLP